MEAAVKTFHCALRTVLDQVEMEVDKERIEERHHFVAMLGIRIYNEKNKKQKTKNEGFIISIISRNNGTLPGSPPSQNTFWSGLSIEIEAQRGIVEIQSLLTEEERAGTLKSSKTGSEVGHKSGL